MIQTGTTFVEWLSALQIGELVNPHERPSHKPDNVVKGTGVLIDHRIGAEQLAIPGPAAL
jgi:hypothetical protein